MKVIGKFIFCRYLTNPNFDPDAIKKVSRACEGLCLWVRAMVTYHEVIKVVAPMQQKLDEANTEVDIQMKELAEKKKALKKVSI